MGAEEADEVGRLGCMPAGEAASWMSAAVVEDDDALSLPETPIEKVVVQPTRGGSHSMWKLRLDQSSANTSNYSELLYFVVKKKDSCEVAQKIPR